MWSRSLRAPRGRLMTLQPKGLSSMENGFGAVAYHYQQEKRFKSKFAYPEGMTDYENDWAETEEYPEITEQHKWNEARRQRYQKKMDWHARIKNASCPESKNLEFNMPK